MKNKMTVLAPARMKEVYCHKCGDLLMKHANTRIVKRGDPDYKKHSRLDRGFVHRLLPVPLCHHGRAAAEI